MLTATNFLLAKPPALLAADTTTLAPVAENKVALVVSPFTPAPNLVLSSLTLASFTGYAALAAGATGGVVGVDPITGAALVSIKDPVGGWQWVTSGTTGLPQTVFGYVLVDDAETLLLGSALLDAPITLTGTGQSIIIGSVALRFPNGYLSGA